MIKLASYRMQPSVFLSSLSSCLHTKFSFPSLQFACAFCSLSIFQSCFPAFFFSFFFSFFSFCVPHSYPAMVSEWAKFGTYAPTLLPAWTFGTFGKMIKKTNKKMSACQHHALVLASQESTWSCVTLSPFPCWFLPDSLCNLFLSVLASRF